MAKNAKKPDPYPPVYTVDEFAKIFKISRTAVRTLIRKGEIPAVRIGSEHRIPQAVIDHYFAQAAAPEERGFGMWAKHRISSVTFVNKLRSQDRRAPEVFLKMTEDG